MTFCSSEVSSAEAITKIVFEAISGALTAQQQATTFRDQGRAAGYSDDQLRLAELAHQTEKPTTDTTTWLKQFAEKNRIQLTPPGTNGSGVASARTVPRTVDESRDSSGLIDVFSLSPEQVMQLGPQRLRSEFEKALNVARGMSGAPPVPEVSRKK